MERERKGSLGPGAGGPWFVALLMTTLAGGASAQTVEETLTIGAAMGAVEESFQTVADLEVTRDGRIGVLDEGDGSIRVFGPDGRFVAGFGGTGEGPAEFRHIGASALAGDTLIVLDREGGKLVHFALDGTLLETRRTDFAVSRHGFPVRLHALRGGALILEGASGCSLPPVPSEDTQWRLLVIPRDATGLRELRRDDRGDALAVYGTERPMFCAVLDLPFRPGPRAAVRPEGAIAFGTGAAPRIELYGEPAETPTGAASLEGGPARTLSPAGSRRAFTAEDGRAWERSALAARAGAESPREIADRFRDVVGKIEFPDLWPAYDRLVFDDAGELWVRRPPSIDAITAEWDVLRPDGAHRGTVALPAGLEVRAVARGRVYGVTQGEWDEDLVKRFDVRWN